MTKQVSVGLSGDTPAAIKLGKEVWQDVGDEPGWEARTIKRILSDWLHNRESQSKSKKLDEIIVSLEEVKHIISQYG